jgi:hypothetical protein
MPETTERKQAMKFQPGQSGNPTGRPKGARHKTTLAIESLLDGEAQALTRKVIEKAKEGDMTALKLCLDRLAPVRKGRTLEIDLPDVNCAADLAQAGAVVTQQLGEGVISPEEAAAVMGTLDSALKLFEAGELEARIAALEEQVAT